MASSGTPQDSTPTLSVLPEPRWLERTDVLDTIDNKLTSLEESGEAHLINYHGITGIGKTTLLAQVFDTFRQTYPIIWFDFDPHLPAEHAARQQGFQSVLPILRTFSALEYLPDAITSDQGRDIDADAYRLVFTSTMPLTPQPDRPLLVLFDHLDDIICWQWIQEEIIKPLMAQQPTLVICASQSPLYWHFWELNEQCERVALARFSDEKMLAYAQTVAPSVLADDMPRATYGYPQMFDPWKSPFAARPRYTPPPPLDLEQVWQQVSPLARTVLRYAGVLRRLETPVMRRVLDTMASGWHGDRHPVGALEDALRELTNQGYLEPLGTRQRPRQLIPSLRVGLEEQLRREEPEIYQQICHLVAAHYSKQFHERPREHPEQLNEWLFFSTVSLQGETSSAARAAWDERLDMLVARARLAGKGLIILFYKDYELRARLQAQQLLDHVQQRIEQHLGSDEPARRFAEHREWQETRRNIIERWSKRLPEGATQPLEKVGGLYTVLEFILDALEGEPDKRLKPDMLHQEMIEWERQNIKPGDASYIIAVLQSSGLLLYDYTQRAYYLNEVVEWLLTGKRATTTSQSVTSGTSPGSSGVPTPTSQSSSYIG